MTCAVVEAQVSGARGCLDDHRGGKRPVALKVLPVVLAERGRCSDGNSRFGRLTAAPAPTMSKGLTVSKGNVVPLVAKRSTQPIGA